ncbi:sensor histidine kinase [Dankookia sp. P2]|uniref:sensor histidine kinase n=1 Tax=Dankookia sp. P2 TaxID=3423955 RepID=UPI003D67E24E
MAWVGPVSAILRPHPTGVRAWAIALALFAASLAARLALERWLAPIAFLTFYPAIIAAALVCGWRQGLLVVALSTLAGWYLFLEPHGSFAFRNSGTPVILAGFVTVALFQVVLLAALAEVIRRLEALQAAHADLFRELQHRVANNMQLVASTLHVAQRRITDPEAREVIGQATARVDAMARLHRKLYDPDSYRNGLEPVLREVLGETFQGLPVRLDIRLAPGPLTIGQMTAIVLLVNEAAINAAKHVFRPEQGSAFEVALRPGADGRLLLEMRDDGPGLGPAQPGGEASRRLGMTIMQSLARQLGGCLEVLDGPGMALGVHFASR